MGTLYKYTPRVHIKVTGSAPLSATVHQTEKLRCNGCLKIFEADFEGKTEEKYDNKAKSIIALLKYGASTPFYRLEQIQKHLLIPLPSSTQWDLMESLADDLIHVWKALINMGADGDIGHIDDTTAKVLDLMKD